MFYLITAGSSVLLVTLLNFLLGESHALSALGTLFFASLFGAGAAFAIDGILAFLIRRLPERFFSPESPLFSVSGAERRFYRRIGINGWKDKVPEWGGLTGFHKNHLASPRDSRYLARFLLESNYGVAIHAACALGGFLILLLPFSGKLSVGLPIACVNLVLNLLPAMILRFNTPPLRHLYRRSLEKAGRSAVGRAFSDRGAAGPALYDRATAETDVSDTSFPRTCRAGAEPPEAGAAAALPFAGRTEADRQDAGRPKEN